MGLIDDIRKKRDSWTSRFEEHRQDEEEYENNIEVDKKDEEIMKNRKMVGIFPKNKKIE